MGLMPVYEVDQRVISGRPGDVRWPVGREAVRSFNAASFSLAYYGIFMHFIASWGKSTAIDNKIPHEHSNAQRSLLARTLASKSFHSCEVQLGGGQKVR